MFSPGSGVGHGGDLVDSGVSDATSSRLIPRGTHTGDEELVFRNDSRRSKAVQNQSYMASISTGQKVRHTMASVGSASSSSTSVNQVHSPRPASSMSEHGGRVVPARQSSRGGGGGGPSSPPGSREYPEVPVRRRGAGAAGGHQRQPSIDARGYLRTLNELFFGKFCVDELFCREFREQLVRRIQESTFRYTPADLQDILDDVVEACKSTRLSLDVVSQWRLNYFVRNQSASVIDHIFLMNANVMAYDPRFSSMCLDTFCADPLCSEIHAGRVTEEDKAKAFRRVLNVVLNEALRVRLVTKEQKTEVRARLVKSTYATEDRIGAVRELAVLVLLGQDEARRELAAYAISGFGLPWTQPDLAAAGPEESCNLDPDMVHRKALSIMNNAYLESILDVRRLGMSISADEVAKLRTLWARHSTRSPDAAGMLTLPMLLHLLVHCSEDGLQEALPQPGAPAAVGGGEAGGLSSRIEQVEDAALQIVQNLGLAWELGDNPPRDLRQFCMVLLLDLGSVLSRLLVHEAPGRADAGPDSDAREIGVVEDGLFAKWWDVCDAVVRFERLQRRYHTAFVVLYIKLESEKLLGQKADFHPELFLTMAIELLTEYRKRRPDYEAIVLTPDGRQSLAAATEDAGSARSSGSTDAVGQRKPGQQQPPAAAAAAASQSLDKRTREEIGSEFDRLFGWVDQQLPATNSVRSLSRASSPKSRTSSWRTSAGGEKAASPSAASIGYGSSTGGNRVMSTLPPIPVRSPAK